MIKAIIFDADGVLVDSTYLSTRLIDQHKERGWRWNKDLGPREPFDRFFSGPFLNCLIGKADLKEEVSKVVQEWPWDKSVDELLEYWFHPEFNRVDDRFAPLIADLRQRGIICALGTNNEKYRTHDLVHTKGIGKWMDKIFSSAHVGSKKPEPEFFAHICADLNLEPHEIILWDDDPKNIEGALAAGMQAKLYTNFEELKKFHE